jgi:hypothetical protein
MGKNVLNSKVISKKKIGIPKEITVGKTNTVATI